MRNALMENFETLLRMMRSDADGEFPYVAQRVIAEHYAMTGDVLTLREVEDVLLQKRTSASRATLVTWTRAAASTAVAARTSQRKKRTSVTSWDNSSCEVAQCVIECSVVLRHDFSLCLDYSEACTWGPPVVVSPLLSYKKAAIRMPSRPCVSGEPSITSADCLRCR